MTPSERLDRAEKALNDAAFQLAKAETRQEVFRAEGVLCDARRDLREAETEYAQMLADDLREYAERVGKRGQT